MENVLCEREEKHPKYINAITQFFIAEEGHILEMKRSFALEFLDREKNKM